MVNICWDTETRVLSEVTSFFSHLILPRVDNGPSTLYSIVRCKLRFGSFLGQYLADSKCKCKCSHLNQYGYWYLEFGPTIRWYLFTVINFLCNANNGLSEAKNGSDNSSR